MEIELTYRRNDFEELYFKNGNGSYFRDKTINSHLRNLIISLVVSIGFYIYSIYSNSYILFFTSLIITLFILTSYTESAINIWKWRKEVKEYLNGIEQFKEHKIVTNAEYFSIFQDNKQTIEKWIGIKSVQLYDTHILIYGIEKFLIPAKSMKKDEYNSLKVLISEKLKIT